MGFGSKAYGFCGRCGFRYKLSDLKPEVVNYRETDARVCPTCWDPDQPQLHVNELEVDDPRALRDPRPVGATSGRELPYAYRWNFINPVELSNPDRFDGWWESSETPGVLSVNQAENMLTYAPMGDSWLVQGYNGVNKVPSLLSIDASKYKFVTAVIRVNTLPDFEPDDIYKDDWQGDFFWSSDTTTVTGLPLTNIVIDVNGNATFTFTGTDVPVVGNRFNFYSLEGTYPATPGGTIDLVALNGVPPDEPEGPRLKYTVTDVSGDTFTVSNFGLLGNGSSQALSGSPIAVVPWPYTGNVSQKASPVPYFYNMGEGAFFKIIWDLSDHEYWTGTPTSIRLDFFDSKSVSEPSGDIDIEYIAVEAYHNPDL